MFTDVLRGKRVVVTGSSTGIGEQIAYHYARLGASVLVTARREAALKQVTQVIGLDGSYRLIGDKINQS